MAIAQAVADSPAVLSALRDPDPSLRIQPFAEDVRVDTATDFVVVMALDRTRYSHPNPALIGRPFVGDLGDAPQGGTFTQEFTGGSLGPSVRAVVPVLGVGGEPVALVSVGITLDRIGDAVWSRLLRIAVVAPALLLLGAGGPVVRREEGLLDGLHQHVELDLLLLLEHPENVEVDVHHASFDVGRLNSIWTRALAMSA